MIAVKAQNCYRWLHTSVSRARGLKYGFRSKSNDVRLERRNTQASEQSLQRVGDNWTASSKQLQRNVRTHGQQPTTHVLHSSAYSTADANNATFVLYNGWSENDITE